MTSRTLKCSELRLNATLLLLAAGVLFFPTPVSAATLVDHYSFDGNGTDSEGGDANGVLSDPTNVTFETGVIGQGALFGVSNAGADNRIEVPQGAAFNPGAGDFSIALFAQRNDTEPDKADGVLDGLSGTGVGFQMQFEKSGTLRFRLDGSELSFDLINMSVPVVDNEFHHYAITIDRENSQARWYIDGAFDVMRAVTVTGDVTPSQSLWLGGFNNGTATGFDGILDDLRFYTGVLTPEEVETLAAAVMPEPEPGDYNGDDIVALLDLAIIQSRLDADLDRLDVAELAGNYGFNAAAPSPGAAVSVPEPSTLWLAVAGCFACLGARRGPVRLIAE